MMIKMKKFNRKSQASAPTTLTDIILIAFVILAVVGVFSYVKAGTLSDAQDCEVLGGHCLRATADACGMDSGELMVASCENFAARVNAEKGLTGSDKEKADNFVCCGAEIISQPEPGSASYQVITKKFTGCDLPITGSAPGFTLEVAKSYLASNYPRSPLLRENLINYIFMRSSQININPIVVFAMFEIETRFGTLGAGVKNKNPGNLRIGKYCARQYGGTPNGGFCKYDSWQQGVEAWFLVMYNFYIDNEPPRTTVSLMLDKYAPASENNQKSYAAHIVSFASQYMTITECELV